MRGPAEVDKLKRLSNIDEFESSVIYAVHYLFIAGINFASSLCLHFLCLNHTGTGYGSTCN